MTYRTSIGLDVHARSIKAAAFIPETGEVVESSFAYDAADIVSWASSLPQPVHAVYESGPTGFELARSLETQGLKCEVGAVTKMLRPSGDRVKTDKRDAVFLARMLAVGNIVSVRIPTLEDEAARDLARARGDAREDLIRAKQQLSKFLLRKGLVYNDGSAWTQRHRRWLSSLTFTTEDERFVFDDCLANIAVAEQRRDRLGARIEERAKSPVYAHRVARLTCLRGISVLTAFSIIVEVGDFSRFPNASAFSSYLGLIPSESSSGETRSRGRITKTGNSHVRKLLTEAAWVHSRSYNPMSVSVNRDMRSVPASVASRANKANRRLHERYVHLKRRGKHVCTVNSAIARELAGWVWALENEMV